MNPLPRVTEALLVPWLALLALVSGVAVLQALFLPTWPRVQPPSQAALQRSLLEAGLEPASPSFRPSRRSPERALSRQLRWTLSSGAQLSVVNGSVSRYQNLQIAFLGRGIPDLQLQGRQLDHPVAGSAAGSIQGRPAVQTCLVPQFRVRAVAAVTRAALLRASDPRLLVRLLRDPATWRDPAAVRAILVALLGPRDFSCQLVSLRSGSTQPLPPALWPRVLTALQASPGPVPGS